MAARAIAETATTTVYRAACRTVLDMFDEFHSPELSEARAWLARYQEKYPNRQVVLQKVVSSVTELRV